MYKDYYKTLGIARNASQEEIRKAFRGLARQYHPDIARDNPAAEERFKEINEAYEVLSDAKARRRYNRIDGHSWDEAEGAGESWEFRGTGFSEFFHDFFANRRARAAGAERETASSPPPPPTPPPRKPEDTGRAASAKPGDPQRGGDLTHELLITLNQALHGAKKKIAVKRPAAAGREPEQETIAFSVPAGIREGQTIRLGGKGKPGRNGGDAGDLLLQVFFMRHPDFEVDGADLHCLLKIAPWDAVLGGEALLPTLDKPVPIKIKPGTQGGRSLRVRGLGLLNRDGTRGDIIAEIQIVVPNVTGPQEMRHWKKLKTLTRWNPSQSS